MDKLRLVIQKARAWPVAAYLILAAYGIIDAAVFMQSPYSGRISTLTCQHNSQGQPFCTVTIFGFREIYRRSFRPDEFIEAVYYNTVGQAATSDAICDGITILTKSGKINFVFPYQRTYDFEYVARDINRAFKGDSYPSTPIFFIGFNWSLYRRAILLLVGLGILIYWSRSKKWQAGAPIEPIPKTRSAFANFAFSWWWFNLLVRLTFFIPLVLIIPPIWDTYYPADILSDACYCNGGLPSCGLVSPVLPFNHLICLYPLLAFATLQALVQWKFLKSKINLSRWWIAAPALAILPMAIGFQNHIDCAKCAALKYVLSGIGLYRYEPSASPTMQILTGLLIYFLLVGGIQSLALRSRSPVAIGWAFVPLINTATLVVSGLVIRRMWNLPPEAFCGLYLSPLLIALALQDICSALYASWLVHSKKVPAS